MNGVVKREMKRKKASSTMSSSQDNLYDADAQHRTRCHHRSSREILRFERSRRTGTVSPVFTAPCQLQKRRQRQNPCNSSFSSSTRTWKWIPSLSFCRGEEQQTGAERKVPTAPAGCEMPEWRHGANKSPPFFVVGIFFAVPSGAGFPLLGTCSGQQCLAG